MNSGHAHHNKGDLVFVEASKTHGTARLDGSFTAKEWSTNEFEQMIRDHQVAQPVQSVGQRDYFVNYEAVCADMYSKGTIVIPPQDGENFVDSSDEDEAMQADEDYYRYGGYGDFEQDYEDYGEYDDFEDYDGYGGYDEYQDMVYDRGFEAGYRSALRQLAIK